MDTPNAQRFTLLDYVMALLMGLLIVVVFVPIVLRGLFGILMPWPDEMARLLMIWMVYMGLAACYRVGAHIEIDIVYMYMPKPIQKGLDLLKDLIYLAINALIIKHSFELTIQAWPIALPATNLPNGLMPLSLLLGSIILVVYVIKHMISTFRSEDNSIRPQA